MKRILATLFGLSLVTACTTTPERAAVATAPPASTALREVACAAHKLAITGLRCFDGRDDAGSIVFVAVPARWNGILVLHAHGGPFLGAPTMARVDEDVARWSIVPKAGYAWAVTSYHQGGVAVRSAAGDIERLRTIALATVGRKPDRIILHGQSWGGNVAAKEAELANGRGLYDGVLLTSGVLAGGPRAYEHRYDLRVIYQYLCRNLPRPDEPQYPLWMGLPADSTMTHAQLEARVAECLGHDNGPRTPEQATRLRELVTTVRIPATAVVNELTFATATFAEIAQRYRASVFGNSGALYDGIDDPAFYAALNAGVERQIADPAARKAFTDDTDLDGDISVPVLTMHATSDPVAFVEMESRFRDRMIAAGHGATLVQTFSDDAVHSYVSDATYVALLEALTAWVRDGRKATPAGVATACPNVAIRFPSSCHFRLYYDPAPLETRVTDRRR